jgi:hypothetical protein
MVIVYNKDTNQKTLKETVLKYNEKYNAYVNDSAYEENVMFIGNDEDFCNVNLKNYDIINKKMNLNMDYYALKCHYELQIPGQPIIGYVKVKENQMPYGIYSLVKVDFTEFGFRSININSDDYIDFNNVDINDFEKKLSQFFDNRSKYNNLGARHKGATLLYGPPGSGKSTSIVHSIKNLCKDKYCFFIGKGIDLSVLNEFKESFKGQNVIIILEEVTERLGMGTEDLLNFLDGYSSWDNCYVIATTNYPEQLPPNLANRPGRFNNLIEIKLPTDEQKTIFLEKKGFSLEEIQKVLPKTKEFSIDEISQLALHSKIENQPLDVYLKILEDNKKKAKSSFKGKSRMGLE